MSPAIGHVVFARVPLPWPRPRHCTSDVCCCLLNFLLLQDRKREGGPVGPFIARAVHPPGRHAMIYRLAVTVTSRLIAQMKAASSRAIAVATTVDFLPFLDNMRNRLQSRTCAFHAISRAGGGAAAT